MKRSWMRVENVSVLVATVESMERVSGRFPAFRKGRKKEVATMLKAIHAQENMEEATKKKEQIARKLSNMKFGRAAELVRSGSEETLSYYGFPA